MFVYENGVGGDQLLPVLVPKDPPDPGVSLDPTLHHHFRPFSDVGRVDSLRVNLHVDNGQVVNVEHPKNVQVGSLTQFSNVLFLTVGFNCTKLHLSSGKKMSLK